MKKFLILNSENNLSKNYKNYFLGHWCLQDIKGSFKNLSKYKILNFKKNDSQVKKDIKITQKIYFNLLTDLVKKLNNFHKRKFSKKYWDIVLGPWLKVFIEIVYERYRSLENALEKKKVNYVVLAKYDNSDFFTDNVLDLVSKDIKKQDDWNFILYTKIFKFLNKKTKKVLLKSIDIPKKSKNNYKKKKNFFLIFAGLLSNLLKPFWKKNDFVIYEPDMSVIDTIKIYLRLGQLPKINIEPNYKIKPKNIELRKKLFFSKNKVNKIEKFIRSILPDMLPTDIIENYQNLDKLSDNLNLPEKPSFVFTAYGYHGKEVFQMWLGKKIENKTKYFLCQHGANHTTSRNTIIESGFKNCDKFFSWGEDKNKKCVALFNTKNINTNIDFEKNGDKIYFFAPPMYPKRSRPYNDYEKMIKENLEMEKILGGLNKKIRKKVVIKIYPVPNFQKEFVNKILNEITFKNRKYEIADNNGANKKFIYGKSRIIIHSGDGTSILETLSADIPSVFIMENLNWIRNSCKKDYKYLVKAKILFFDYNKLINHVNKYYNKIDDWWKNKEVIKAKNNFCNKYCKPAPKNYLNKLENCIIDNVK